MKEPTGLKATLVLGAVYLIGIVFVGLKFHVMADGDSETDFLAGYVPQARSFLSGSIMIDHYRGPVYPMFLGALSVLLRPFGLGLFETGIILSALSAASVLVLIHLLFKRLFDPWVSLAAALLVIAHPIFLRYSYTTGNDMFFAALATLVVFLVLSVKAPGWKRLLAAGAVAGLAYLTRYNGVSVVVGALACIVLVNPWRLAWKRRLLGALFFAVALGVVVVPWGMYTLSERGVFLYNENPVNVAVTFHSGDQPPEYFRAANRDRFNSYTDVVMYDPIGFFSQIPRRVGTYLVQVLQHLTGSAIGVLAVLGMLLLLVQRPTRDQVGYYLFGVLFLGVLSLVFYNGRFLLFMIPLFMVLSVQAILKIAGQVKAEKVRRVSCIAIIGALILYNGINSVAYNRIEVPGGDIAFRKMGERFQRQFPAERGGRVVARKPFFAYFAGLESVQMPVVRSVDDLVRYMHTHKADYLLFSFIAARTRPMLAELLDPTLKHQGLNVVAAHKRIGVLYRLEKAGTFP